jgi:hypothetical protein
MKAKSNENISESERHQQWRGGHQWAASIKIGEIVKRNINQ